MKYVVFLGDGMADRPVAELGGHTPLEVAEHPVMDRLAQNGAFGMVQTVPDGMKPGSDTANLAVFGYDPRIYYSGRSPLEAASIGIDLNTDDVAYRCNLVTLSEADTIDDAVMIDYSAGEISSEEAKKLVDALNEAFASQTYRLYPGFSYRQCFVMHHANTGARLTPPHDISLKRVNGCLPEGENAALLRAMMEYAYRTLKQHPVNLVRMAAGKKSANAIWFWGEGRRPALKPFFEMRGVNGAVISAVDLIQGIGKCAAMKVIPVAGATGNFHTNFEGKGLAAIEALSSGFDFVYIHVEAPDECGHQGQITEKIHSIEQIEQKIVRPVIDYLNSTDEAYAVLLLPDHPTPVHLRTHTGDPVPFVLYRRGDQKERTHLRYTEVDASRTGVFEVDGYRLLDRMMKK